MNLNGILQLLLFFALLLICTKPMGLFMLRAFRGQPTFVVMDFIARPIERLIYRILAVNPKSEMSWIEYCKAMLMFSCLGALCTQMLLRLQGVLPLNPQGFGINEMTPDLAYSTAISFMTNTNWQSYSPEVTISYFSNMVALAIHNWISAAVGIAVALAVVRGFSRDKSNTIGNFWVDVVRAAVYVLLPISLVAAVIYLYTGVPQNFNPYQHATTLEGADQVIAQGPVASQEAIKILGTNGGGIFNANSAHPFENPTPGSNLLTVFLIFLIPFGLTYTFGRMVRNSGQGWAICGAMSVLFITGAVVCALVEQAGTPRLANLGVEMSGGAGQSGGNMEGKEQRFGIGASTLFATVTTAASCGAVNSMHDSYTPLGGLVLLFNMLSGEVIFGGVGAGLYGMLMFAVLAVFIAGLMVGRTPEYIGKKIQRFEVQMAMLAILILAASVLGFTALGATLEFAENSSWNRVGSAGVYLGTLKNNLNNSGAHGFSEILYAYASTTGNNGSAFAGITVNTPYYNLTLGLAMLMGRFLMIVPLLAMAGSLAHKKRVPLSVGSFPTDTITFSLLLVGTVVIVGALTYFPALALGPIVEHLQMYAEILRN